METKLIHAAKRPNGARTLFFTLLMAAAIHGGNTRAQNAATQPVGQERNSAPKALTVLEKQAILRGNAALSAQKILISPVGITSDFALPWLPDEALTPVNRLSIRAAVNEWKPLALAVTNNTDEYQETRVVIEAEGPRWLSHAPVLGLENFTTIVMRQGSMMRETSDGRYALIDSLPCMNESHSILIPPHQSSLVWIDFNTEGMKPGKYTGRLLAIPLCGAGEFKGKGNNLEYTGDACVLPIEFVIDDIELPREPVKGLIMDSSVPLPNAVRLYNELGCRWYCISIWCFAEAKNDQGDFAFKAPVAERDIRFYQQEAAKYGFRPKFQVMYSAWSFATRMLKDNKEDFQKWLKALSAFMQAHDVRPDEWYLEIQDEPWANELPAVLEYAKLAKAAAPEVRLLLTVVAGRIKDASLLEDFVPYIDVWTFHRTDWQKGKEWLAFIERVKHASPDNNIYTCETEMFSLLHQNYRTLPWFVECQDFPAVSVYQGFRYTYNQCQYDFKGGTNGTLNLVSFQDAIPTLRGMAVRQGMTDLKYLAVLKQMSPRHPKAREFLETAASRVIQNLEDRNMPDKVREEAASLILRLKQEE